MDAVVFDLGNVLIEWDPLRVVSELSDWQGHSPEEIQAMKDFIADKEPIDD